MSSESGEFRLKTDPGGGGFSDVSSCETTCTIAPEVVCVKGGREDVGAAQTSANRVNKSVRETPRQGETAAGF